MRALKRFPDLPPLLEAAAMVRAEMAVFKAGLDPFILMQRAGNMAAEAIMSFASPCDTLVLCGPGNNGGDGYVVAQQLQAAGWPVRVAALRPPATQQAQQAAALWTGEVEEFFKAAPATLIVDALFGIGMTRPLAADVADSLAKLIETALIKIAIDVPSGVNSDTGACLGARTPFDMTVSFHSRKPAHLLQPAAHLCGRVVVADIGLPPVPSLLCANQLRPRLLPDWQDHKYSRGHVMVVAGHMAGAAHLAAGSAQRSGAGYVSLAYSTGAHAQFSDVAGSLVVRTFASVAELVKMAAAKNIHCLALGPGLGTDDQARNLAQALISVGKPCVLDADIFTLFAQDRQTLFDHLTPDMILTPHAGEFVRLFDSKADNRLQAAQDAAKRAGAVVIYKGSDTIIAHPDGRTAINPPAPPSLATAGTGDILTGIAAALLASGMDSFAAACQAVAMHSAAAALLGPYFVAEDMWDALAHV